MLFFLRRSALDYSFEFLYSFECCDVQSVKKVFPSIFTNTEDIFGALVESDISQFAKNFLHWVTQCVEWEKITYS